MKLEAQIEELAKLGLTLEPGATVDILLQGMNRTQYEERPFDVLLFALGSEIDAEPYGRPCCARAWDFDTECIYDEGSYAEIVNQLVRIADASSRVSNVRSELDFEEGEAAVEYTIDGKQRRWNAEVEGDWADVDVVINVMADLEAGQSKRFFSKDNGQAMTLFFIDEAAAARINALGGQLERVVHG